jgi:murein DD-endopeptidase MepM/ murein hydrolase activator NlpD
VSVERLIKEAHDPFLEEPYHHRWLLTTCIAGIAGTLIIGSALLSIFGQNAAPNDAYASVSEEHEMAGAQMTASLGAVGSLKNDAIVPERDLDGGNAYPEITSDFLPYGDGKTIVLDAEIQAVDNEPENITTIAKTPPPEPTDERFTVGKNRSLIAELVDRGVTREAAQALTAALEPVFPARMLKAGTEFELTLDRQQDFYGRDVTFPVELSFKPGPKETIVVEADEDGRFVARIEGKKEGATSQYAQVNQFRTKARVGSSLYGTAKDHKIPDYIVSELTRVFSYDVDFQRQVKSSDTFEVFYGNPLTGSSTKRKVLHYAQLTLNGQTKTYYRYTTADGQTDYYDENGRSASKALLKTPVSGAKLTSGFGMRRHPLLGYSKMHTGVDFGVPYGTPIRAAGSGIVEVAGRHGAYGVTVKIQHNGKNETLYAHMSKLAAGIRPGKRVNQGQIIGYVGSTGRSTGPHLHYEVRVNDRAVNPMNIKVAGSKVLTGADLKKFRSHKQRVLAMMQLAPSATQVAQANP